MTKVFESTALTFPHVSLTQKGLTQTPVRHTLNAPFYKGFPGRVTPCVALYI